MSDNAEEAWHVWLSEHYATIDDLNDAYGAVFWSTTYNTFAEVPLPRFTLPGGSTYSNEDFRSNMSPGLLLDYRRFRRDTIAGFAAMQVSILRAQGVKGRITTNAPGGFWSKAMDHNDVFSTMDIASYDNYPVWGGSTSAPLPYTVSMTLDTARGWITKTRPNVLSSAAPGWMVAEQLIGAQGHDM